MQIIRKDATVTATGDEEGPGTFTAVLSAPTKDRDGDTLLPDGWKTPLPDRIPVDVDHSMSVAGTVGSAHPYIDEKTGDLMIDGTFASTPKAQEVRTLMKEGHINTTSVAFMNTKEPTKDGRTVNKRELLNAAIVAIPSNREALVTSAKSISEKTGARNSQSDMVHVQAIHDHAIALGADPRGGQKSFLPVRKDPDDDPLAAIAAVDASIDSALELLSSVDPESLPAEVQQAISLVTAADATVDELMESLGIPDPDEDEEPSAEEEPPAASPDGHATADTSAPDGEADSGTAKNINQEAVTRLLAGAFLEI